MFITNDSFFGLSTSRQVNMNRYTIEQHLEIIRIYYQSACSVCRTYRALREIFGQRNRPTERSIYRLVEKFGQTGSLVNKSTHVHRRGAQSEVNIAAVSQSVRDDPNPSIPRRSQELGLSQTTTWIILHQDLHLKAYKFQSENLMIIITPAVFINYTYMQALLSEYLLIVQQCRYAELKAVY
ncbi:hypothetical protein NQ317_018807 [Molorchus minor]|uniref:DUF4817 domain-containing protein n=1 Tax=Molorchus minor TaxID=1323400 RepID=A0ABQ9JDW6_9CUCU|nr:hypothetical protein NQ317_018807 [Molorchus minor]